MTLTNLSIDIGTDSFLYPSSLLPSTLMLYVTSRYSRWAKNLLFAGAFIMLLRAIGLFNYLYVINYEQFQWPHLTTDELRKQVQLQMNGLQPEIVPIYNLSQFVPSINPPKCIEIPTGQAVIYLAKSVLIVVRSAPDRRERRQAIRTTWGLNGLHFGAIFRTIYVMGNQVGTVDYRTEMHGEFNQFGDLLLGNFIDHYDNATMKTQHALNFAGASTTTSRIFCDIPSQASFLLLLDDDEMLFPWNLANLLATKNGSEHLYAGDSVEGVHPARTIFSKWQISLDKYPFDHFPPYIQGNAVLLSQRTFQAFRYTIQYVKPCIWDDVYLGIISRVLDIPVSREPKIVRNWGYFDNLPDFIAVHGFTPDEMRAIYFNCLKRQSDTTN